MGVGVPVPEPRTFAEPVEDTAVTDNAEAAAENEAAATEANEAATEQPAAEANAETVQEQAAE